MNHHPVIPAQAGIHVEARLSPSVDARLRGHDGFKVRAMVTNDEV